MAAAWTDYSSSLLGLSVALGIGLLIGAEREQRKGSGPSRGPAGIRTFAIVALLGAVGMALGGALVLGVVAAIVGAGALLSYQGTKDMDPGMTSEFALLLTCLLGGVAMREPGVAAGVGAVLAALLAARDRMHYFVRSVLSEQELHDIIMFAALALVVLPLAPDRYMGPFAAINPHTSARLVVIVMAISAAGYVAVRAAGPRHGLPVAGFISGFVSSTATIYSMGLRVSRQKSFLESAAAGAAWSSIATMVQLALVVALVNIGLLAALALPLLLGGVAACVYGMSFMLRGAAKQEAAPDKDQTRAFDLKTALAFAVTINVVLLVAAGLNAWLGDHGTVLSAALTGLADAHSTAAAAASLMAAGKVSGAQAVRAILVGLSTNTLTKAAVAFRSGGAPYARKVIPGLAMMMAATWAGAWLSA